MAYTMVLEAIASAYRFKSCLAHHLKKLTRVVKYNMVHIVTAYTRTFDYLKRAYDTIKGLNIDYHWYIVTTREKQIDLTGFKNTTILIKPGNMPMHTGVNYYYDTIPDTGQWVYVLDDDNVLHFNFYLINEHIKNKNCDLIVFAQQVNKQDVRLINNVFDITVQKVDNGQFMVRRNAVGNLRYWPVYRGDGYFATEIRILTYECGRNITILPFIASYYNYQTWE